MAKRKEEKLDPKAKEKEAQKEVRLSPGALTTRRVITAEMTQDGGKPLFTIEIEIEDEPEDCTCYKDGLHSLGSVASCRAGDTDPDCPHHGVN